MADPFSDLLSAAESGDCALLERLIADPAKVPTESVASFINRQNGEGLTALHLAASAGCCDICELLFNNGALLDITDVNAMTPLHHAAGNGMLDIVQFLVEKGAIIDPQNKVPSFFPGIPLRCSSHPRTATRRSLNTSQMKAPTSAPRIRNV
jgi:ankyrin repeat protein